MTKGSIKKILMIEDNAGDARLLRTMSYEKNLCSIEFSYVDRMSAAEAYLAGHKVDCILLDLDLPDAQGLTAIRRARLAGCAIPLVVLTGLDDEATAEQALREGAQDYLIKGQFDARGLQRALCYAAERKRLEQLKDEFVSTVSHELRAPLASISGSLALLANQTDGTLSVQAERLLTIAQTNSQRLVRLVNDILDIEKLESGHVKFNFMRIDVRSLVSKAIEDNQGYAEDYHLRIRLEAQNAIHDVRVDSDRVVQVITNFLSNAIKFSPPNSEIVVSLENKGDFVRISVRDHGPGISDKFKTRVFERFAQSDATNSRQKGGTGLGLSIVKQIVDRLGGAAGFSDAPGGGTIFSVDLPSWERRCDGAMNFCAQPALRL
jgi:signal transduction histidine kinase